MHFAARLAVLSDGRTLAVDDRLELRGASEATVLLSARTDYRRGNPVASAAADLARARTCSFDQLLVAHVAEHRRSFRRVELELGGIDQRSLSTDARLEAMRGGDDDPDLCASSFQYGR